MGGEPITDDVLAVDSRAGLILQSIRPPDAVLTNTTLRLQIGFSPWSHFCSSKPYVWLIRCLGERSPSDGGARGRPPP